MIFKIFSPDQESAYQRHIGRLRCRRPRRLQLRSGDGRQRTRRPRLRHSVGRIYDSSTEETREMEDFRPGPIRE